MKRLILMTAFLGLWPGISAHAQDKVNVRAGIHEDYVRYVFDWGEPVSYSAEKSGPQEITVSFNKAASFDFSQAGIDDHSYIEGITQVGDSAHPAVSIKLKKDSTFRHFKIGDRVILDIFGKNEMPATTSQASKQASEPAEPEKQVNEVRAQPPKAPLQTAPPVKPAEPPSFVEAAKTPGTAQEQAPEKKALDKMAAAEPYVISLSATEAIGMASFIKDGYLWLVLDRNNVQIPPEITGPAPEEFPPFERYELKGGLAYAAKLPENEDIDAYGEGGGLVWRVILSHDPRSVKPVDMERSFEKRERVRGGTAFWPLKETTRVLEVPDPHVGDIVKVVTVKGASEFAGSEKDFVDFTVLPSAIGLALKPKTDDLDIRLSALGAKVTRPGGLALSRLQDVNRRLMREDVTEAVPEEMGSGETIRRIYDFDRWNMGGLQALDENQRILLSSMGYKDKQGRVQDLLTLAKMNIANDRGQEALGFLEYAQQELPDIANSAEYKALRGAAYALAGKYELAMADFLTPALQSYNELDYWKAFSLAWLEDWQQAQKIMPADYGVLVGYPLMLLEKIGLKLAEVALRNGDVAKAESILATLEKDKQALWPWTLAGIDYLKGEAHRQSGEFDQARALWKKLVKGEDDFYRARAGLALTLLELQQENPDVDKAIDRLEGLRYAWRGDELESSINFTLGKLYVDQGRYLKGFGMLREAAAMSPESDIGHDITDYMGARFKTLLLEDENLSPLDAVTVYEEFTELTPNGDEGNKLVQKLAERLVDADLLERASKILQHQVDYRLNGLEKARVATRLAAIYLLDNKPGSATRNLNIAKSIYGADKGDHKTVLYNIELMRARALSQANKTEEALALLAGFEPNETVNRLRADIAWKAGLWEDAAEALADLIIDEAIDLDRPLSADQADLILHRAVALNLSGNRVALTNMRKRYEAAMNKTARAKLFDVITRPRQSAMLADRETLNSIVSEVDIFKDFLESYRNSDISN